MYSKPVYLTTNAPRAAIEGMNIHYHCLDVTVEPERSSPMPLSRETGEAVLYSAHRAAVVHSIDPSNDPSKLARVLSRDGAD